MALEPENYKAKDSESRITEEYRVLHKVANILQTHGDLMDMLQNAMKALTEFEDLKVENKAGIFLADQENRVLRLFTIFGEFNQEFIDMEQTVPFGECLCGRVALSGELLMSESCFSDSRHDRVYKDMKAHGHYIIPLKSGKTLLGVLFLYTTVNPAWYRHSQEVMLSIGGLIGEAIQRKQLDQQMDQYRNHLETEVEIRTADIRKANRNLEAEILNHKKTQEQLRNLSNQIQEIQEKEKSRISREVHDELGQSITAIKMDLLNLKKNLPKDQHNLLEQVESMAGLADKTLVSIQRIAMELRPPILDAFGLGEAIAWQIDEFKKRFKIESVFNCQARDNDLNPELSTTMFRIFQESLTNIARHSLATKIDVTYIRNSGFLILIVKDNGKGLEKEKLDDFNSLGLIGIRERVRFWNGEVTFTGVPGCGTTIHVQVPLNTSGALFKS